jgi:hypothetical protein
MYHYSKSQARFSRADFRENRAWHQVILAAC